MHKLLAILLLTTATSQAVVDFFVSPTGNDGNSGTSSGSPWTLQKGLDNLGPGTNVYMLSGTYTGTNYYLGNSGNSTDRATLTAFSQLGAIIDNHSTSAGGNYNGLIIEADYVTVDGVAFKNNSANGLFNLGSHNVVIDSYAYSNAYSGFNFSDYARSNNIINRCLSERNGTTVYHHGYYLSGQNNDLKNSIARGNSGFGIQLYTSDSGTKQWNNFIYNNFTYGNTAAYGVTIWGDYDGGGSPGTNYFFHNVCLDGLSVAYGTLQITNNILYASPIYTNSPIHNDGDNPATMVQNLNWGSRWSGFTNTTTWLTLKDYWSKP